MYKRGNRYFTIDLGEHDPTILSKKSRRFYDQYLMDPYDELLIDGYARQKCRAEIDTFTTDIRYIISKYYTKKHRKISILHYIQSTTQKTIQKQKRKQLAQNQRKNNCHRYTATLFCNFCFIIPAIAALYIAYYSNNDQCNDARYSIINPILFLYVAGFTLLCHNMINLIIPLIELLFISLTAHDIKGVKCNYELLEFIYYVPLCVMIVFYGIWSIIGLYIHSTEMSLECQASSVGKMLFSWSVIMIIPLTLISALCILVCCWFSRKYIYATLCCNICDCFVDTRHGVVDACEYIICVWCANNAMYCSLFMVNIFFMILGIVTICFAEYVDNNSCNNGDYILDINPVFFLHVGGIVLLCHMVINCILICIQAQIETLSVLIGSCCFMLFYLFWSIMGFYIYSNEISSQCQESYVGKMLFAWSIIITVAFSLPICVLVILYLFILIVLHFDDD